MEIEIMHANKSHKEFLIYVVVWTSIFAGYVLNIGYNKHKQIFKNIDQIIDESALRLLGIVPQSEELTLLSVNHKLKPHGNAMKSFERISKRLLGDNIPLPNPKKIWKER